MAGVPWSKIAVAEVEGELLALQSGLCLSNPQFQRVPVEFTRNFADPQQNVGPESALLQRHP